MTHVTHPALNRTAPSGSVVSSIATIFFLSIRQFTRGKRLWVLGVLFLIPVALAGIDRNMHPNRNHDDTAFHAIFIFISHALIPLVALLYGCGMIQDEIEEQTLTYLLVRPLPRWAIYLAKLMAAWLMGAILTAIFVTLTYIVSFWGASDAMAKLGARVPITIGLFALALITYCSIFGLLSLFVRRTLVVGVVYVVGLEWILANIDFALRRGTVMYYFRDLTLRWVPLDTHHTKAWKINLAEAPEALTCVGILLGVGAILAILGARAFAVKEFRLKTPEGS